MKNSISTAALTAVLPSYVAFGQTTTRRRVEWQEFKTSPDYAPFVNAIKTMQKTSSVSDKRSWNFWSNSHVRYCPHGAAPQGDKVIPIPYFLAWHRGYLYHFEQQLRAISGKSTLMCPYWDYYSNASIPADFLDRSSPLYVGGRVNTNVYEALTMGPFQSGVTNFQKGTSNAFETLLEWAPHDQIHNIIGGRMSTMESPLDPIFWMHHANIDRLWAAWVAAGGGRRMPAGTSSYWNGTLTYASALTLNRNRTINTTGLGYTYRNTTLPSTFPPRPQSGATSAARARTSPDQPVASRPSTAQFPTTSARNTGANRRAIGGVREVALDENSVNARIPVQSADKQSVNAVVGSLQASPFGSSQNARRANPGRYRSVQLILEDMRLTEAGRDGGYFYYVYLNLPASGNPSSTHERHLVGSFGPFEITGAEHHGDTVRLVLPATRVLADVMPQNADGLDVSLVRASGANSPKGQVISIGEVRIELSADDVQ